MIPTCPSSLRLNNITRHGYVKRLPSHPLQRPLFAGRGPTDRILTQKEYRFASKTMPKGRPDELVHNHYRCEEVFGRLSEWLRAYGIKSAKPIHELRKAFGRAPDESIQAPLAYRRAQSAVDRGSELHPVDRRKVARLLQQHLRLSDIAPKTLRILPKCSSQPLTAWRVRRTSILVSLMCKGVRVTTNA